MIGGWYRTVISSHGGQVADAPMFEVLAYEPSLLGILCLRRRELLSRPGTVVTEVTLNHDLLMSSYLTVSERALASRALDKHPGSGLSVLVGGLGLGYTAREVLASPRVGRVEVVEYLPQVIDWVDRRLVPLAEELQSDARLNVVEGDVYARLAAPPATRHDLILVDVDHSPDERLGDDDSQFYSEKGLRRVQPHLAAGGVLAVWSYAENTRFADALRIVFDEVDVEPVTFENDLVGETVTDWLLFARDGSSSG